MFNRIPYGSCEEAACAEAHDIYQECLNEDRESAHEERLLRPTLRVAIPCTLLELLNDPSAGIPIPTIEGT